MVVLYHMNGWLQRAYHRFRIGQIGSTLKYATCYRFGAPLLTNVRKEKKRRENGHFDLKSSFIKESKSLFTYKNSQDQLYISNFCLSQISNLNDCGLLL